MSEDRLRTLAREFAAELQTSMQLQEETAWYEQKSILARELLTTERIPTLTEDELRHFFDKLAAIGYTFTFDGLLGNGGVDGLRNALAKLIALAEADDMPDNLKQAFPILGSGSGFALVSSILCHRYPDRYWMFSGRRTIRSLESAGLALGSSHTSTSYSAVRPYMDKVQQALVEAGIAAANYRTVDEFLWWVSQRPTDRTPRDQVETARTQLEHLLPVEEVRHRCLSLLANSIELAHASNADGWGITRRQGHVRLNAGRLSALSIHPGVLYLTVELDSLDDQTREALGDHLQAWSKWGKSYRVPLADAGFAADTVPPDVPTPVLAGHTTVVEKAPRLVARTPYYVGYSPGLLVYLREFLQRPDLPHPSYYKPDGNGPVYDASSTVAMSLAQQGLNFTPWKIATYYTALQTTGFVILSGISGTGKTKLAQHFAELLPASESSITLLADDVVSVTVRPYMVKYGQLTIPKAAFRLFDPPPAQASQEVTLRFKGESQDCRLTHVAYGNTDYVGVNLRGAARQWFKSDMTVGEQLVLEPTVDEERRLTSLELFRAAEYTGTRTKENGTCENLLFVPVRPDWRDSKSLLGYYNPLTSTYEWTDFLRFLQRAERSYRDRDGLAWFVILDEMNLAHVEYYFADLLSVLESGRFEDGEMQGLTREPLRFTYPEDAEGDLPPHELRLPPNLYVVGTVNVDETTHAFSPKVLDRAFTLEFADVDFADYPPRLNGYATAQDADTARQLLTAFTQDGTFERVGKGIIAAFVAHHSEVRDRLQSLNNLLKPHDMHFGYRVFDEIVTFLSAAEQNEMFVDEEGDDPALDAAVLMKVLPKFHGSRGKLEAPLKAILAWCLDPDSPDRLKIDDALKNIEDADHATAGLQNLPYAHPRTAARGIRMVRALYTDGFAAFG